MWTYLALILAIHCMNCCNADCIWYDQCGDDPDFNDGLHGLNCLYDGPAKLTQDQEMIQMLKEACPHLLLEHGDQGLESNQVALCCAKGQVETFVEQNVLPSAVLGRCPTCLNNFKRIFCDLMCHPGNYFLMYSNYKKQVPMINGHFLTLEWVKYNPMHMKKALG